MTFIHIHPDSMDPWVGVKWEGKMRRMRREEEEVEWEGQDGWGRR